MQRALLTARPNRTRLLSLCGPLAATRRCYSEEKPKSPHAQWYSDVLPAMVPIFLLGSAVYLGLQLAQTRLSHEKYMLEANERVQILEAQVDALQQKREKDAEQGTSPSAQSKGWLW